MSEGAWDKFHAGEDTRMDYAIGFETTFTNGGVAVNPWVPGFYGWFGMGGSVF